MKKRVRNENEGTGLYPKSLIEKTEKILESYSKVEETLFAIYESLSDKYGSSGMFTSEEEVFSGCTAVSSALKTLINAQKTATLSVYRMLRDDYAVILEFAGDELYRNLKSNCSRIGTSEAMLKFLLDLKDDEDFEAFVARKTLQLFKVGIMVDDKDSERAVGLGYSRRLEYEQKPSYKAGSDFIKLGTDWDVRGRFKSADFERRKVLNILKFYDAPVYDYFFEKYSYKNKTIDVSDVSEKIKTIKVFGNDNMKIRFKDKRFVSEFIEFCELDE